MSFPNERPADSAREAYAGLVFHAANSGGVALGPISAEERPPWAEELIRQFNEVENRTACPHLRQRDRAMLWLAIAPDLLACFDCRDALIARVEERLGHGLADEPSRCSVCRQVAPVRGVSLSWERYLLRGMLCSICEDGGPMVGEESDVDDARRLAALRALGLPAIEIDWQKLRETNDRSDFDIVGYGMLRRAGMLCERVIEAVDGCTTGRRRGLSQDEAVIGGLLVRTAKLTRAIFDSTQADESEAHSPLSRSLGETCITLRWLVHRSDPGAYRRFRADSFRRWRNWLNQAEAEGDADEGARKLREMTKAHIEDELEVAGLSWDDVPERPNSWGPDVRQRFEALGQGSIYHTLFVSHSNYVHPTWHEIRAFHLRSDETGIHLDYTYAGIPPIAAFLLAQLVAEACGDSAKILPHNLDAAALETVVNQTIQVSHKLSYEFSQLALRGGLDADLHRHDYEAPWRSEPAGDTTADPGSV